MNKLTILILFPEGTPKEELGLVEANDNKELTVDNSNSTLQYDEMSEQPCLNTFAFPLMYCNIYK